MTTDAVFNGVVRPTVGVAISDRSEEDFQGWTFASFPNNIAAISRVSNLPYFSELIAHEVGHAFKLKHTSLYNNLGMLKQEYADISTPLSSAIMGRHNVSNASPQMPQWQYWRNIEDVTSAPDDIAVIANAISSLGGVTPFRTTEPDGSADYGNTTTSAATLSTVPGSLGTKQTASTGIINSMTDVDYFQFTPNASGYYDIMLGRDGPASVDLLLEVRNSSSAYHR